MAAEQHHLLTFIVAHEARERVIDLLMGDDRITGFTASDCEGFSREHSNYDLTEQISGARRVTRFEILGDRSALLALRTTLRDQRIMSAGAPAWITTVE